MRGKNAALPARCAVSLLPRSLRRGMSAALALSLALALVPAVAAAGVGISISPSVPQNLTGGVNASAPSISTFASGSVPLGGALTDTAAVSGLVGPDAGGTVEFRIYGPDDATCSSVPIFTSVRTMTVNGTVGTATSLAFTPTSPGTYRWRAFYSGDANNAQVNGPCNAANENVVVSPPPPPPPPLPPPPPPPLPPPPPPPFGTLAGIVTDTDGPNGRAVNGPQPNAPVEACPVPLNNQACRTTQSDAAGQYRFFTIPVGNYELTANPPAGDTTHTQGTVNPVTVFAGQTTTAEHHPRLRPGGAGAAAPSTTRRGPSTASRWCTGAARSC